MKKGIVAILFLTIVISACLAIAGKSKTAIPDSKGFAVIELFSSEGCSSCPPAEALMRKLIATAGAKSQPVYVLEFHVDYWDYLGWKDTFATPAYSQRQQAYGDFMKLSSIYTPQAIINGRAEMVGSDEQAVNAALSKELQHSSSVTLNCKADKTNNSKVEVHYTITGNTTACELIVAVVESNLTVYVKRGENAHKTLIHDNVVRAFKSIPIKAASGETDIEVPHVNFTNAKLICFVQNTLTRDIVGATQVSFLN